MSRNTVELLAQKVRNPVIFTAKIKDKTIATIEISLKDYLIIQCRAFANKVCQYQDRIAKSSMTTSR